MKTGSDCLLNYLVHPCQAEFVVETSKKYTGGKALEISLKQYYKEFKKVIDAADVIIEVLDARDPLGSRCVQVEEAVLSSGTNKKLVLMLNKIGECYP